ncbi:2024_t:CDS:2, partial [Racocetra persica]
YQQQSQYGSGLDNKTTLWMGELEPWMDESYVRQIWYQLGENVNVKFIRDKFTGANAGYCFVDFVSNAAAVKALSTVNGTLIPGTNRVFKLNWASGGGLTDRKDDRGPEFSIFVGDLGPEVTEWMLVSVFQQRYPTCKSAKIMTDPMTGMSRGYGFVRFADEAEQQRALLEMQGSFCGNRPMRISTATPKNKSGLPGTFYQQPSQQAPILNQYNDPNNTTVFVGGLSGVNSEEELR